MGVAHARPPVKLAPTAFCKQLETALSENRSKSKRIGGTAIGTTFICFGRRRARSMNAVPVQRVGALNICFRSW